MLKHTKHLLLAGIVCFFTIAFVSKKEISCKAACPIRMEVRQSKSGNRYTIIHQEKSKAGFEIKRPSPKDTTVCLCIAAAFTQLKDNRIDGVYMHNGTLYQKSAVSRRLGGAAHILNGKISFIDTKKGAFFTAGNLDSLQKTGGGLFQQIMIVQEGKAARFKDTALFQRRAIVHFTNGNTAIIENNKPVRLADFSNDLVELGVKEALYTDMGSWDEGWYKDPQNCKLVVIGQIRSQTARQSNWFVFRK